MRKSFANHFIAILRGNQDVANFQLGAYFQCLVVGIPEKCPARGDGRTEFVRSKTLAHLCRVKTRLEQRYGLAGM